MSDPAFLEDGVSWRLASPRDVPFLYELVGLVDPRWWRFSRHGLAPQAVTSMLGSVAAGAIVTAPDGSDVAAAVLADGGSSGTGTIEFFARPDAESERIARMAAPVVLAAAFNGVPIRRLYRERFEGDADVWGVTDSWFEREVTYPDYALIGGRYEARHIDVLTAERYAAVSGHGT